jgi:hypothetical protein
MILEEDEAPMPGASMIYTATHVPTEIWVSFTALSIKENSYDSLGEIEESLHNIPRAPLVLGQSELPCPYCCVPLPRDTFLLDPAWR